MDSEKKDIEKKDRSNDDLREDVELAKAALIGAAEAFQPLGFVGKHPAASVGGAFFLGFGAMRLFRNGSAIAVAPLAVQLSRVLLKFLAK